MKIAFTKKKILFSVLLIASVLLFTLLTLLFLHNKGVINIIPISLDKYESIAKYCDIKSNMGIQTVKCNALLNYFEPKEDGTECFNISIITDKNTLEDLTICEEKDYVKWDSKIMLTTQIVPLIISLNYQTEYFKEGKLVGIEFSLMDDETTFEKVQLLNRNGLQVHNIRYQSNIETENKGYYEGHSEEIIPNSGIKTITFSSVNIKEFRLEGEDIIIVSDITINGEIIPVRTKTKHLYTLNLQKEFEEEFTLLDSSSFVNIDLDSSYQLGAFYISNENSDYSKVIADYCNADNKEVLAETYCINSQGRELKNISTSIDKYLGLLSQESENDPEELIFFILTKNG